jgi:hypothetical protein
VLQLRLMDTVDDDGWASVSGAQGGRRSIAGWDVISSLCRRASSTIVPAQRTAGTFPTSAEADNGGGTWCTDTQTQCIQISCDMHVAQVSGSQYT